MMLAAVFVDFDIIMLLRKSRLECWYLGSHRESADEHEAGVTCLEAGQMQSLEGDSRASLSTES